MGSCKPHQVLVLKTINKIVSTFAKKCIIKLGEQFRKSVEFPHKKGNQITKEFFLNSSELANYWNGIVLKAV